MASINTIVKRKQYLWLGIVVVGAASAIGGALYLSDVDMSGNGEAVAEQEPVPDMTGVVDTTFDDKVRQHATTEMQVTAAQMQKQYEEIRRELDVLNKQRGDDQRRIEKLGQDNRYSGKCIIVCIRRFFLPEFSLYLHEFNVQCWPGKRAVGYFPLVRGDRFAGDTGAGTDRQWLYC